MPQFDAPEYASYVSLCRELRLEREWRMGDFYWSGDLSVIARWDERPEYGGEEPFWLPQLADWLDMLEAAGQPEIAFQRTPWNWECGRPIPEGDGRTIELVPSGGVAPTREEAAARLWIAVTDQLKGA